jgi:hypothetical protein
VRTDGEVPFFFALKTTRSAASAALSESSAKLETRFFFSSALATTAWTAAFSVDASKSVLAAPARRTTA